MKSSSLAKIYALMMMSGCFMESNSFNTQELTPIEASELKKMHERQRIKQLLTKGCKEFHYDYRISDNLVKEFTIIALNKKNADRKYSKCIKLWKDSI